jgi:hypothetical protein
LIPSSDIGIFLIGLALFYIALQGWGVLLFALVLVGLYLYETRAASY